MDNDNKEKVEKAALQLAIAMQEIAEDLGLDDKHMLVAMGQNICLILQDAPTDVFDTFIAAVRNDLLAMKPLSN